MLQRQTRFPIRALNAFLDDGMIKDSIGKAVMKVGRNKNCGVMVSEVMMKVERNENYRAHGGFARHYPALWRWASSHCSSVPMPSFLKRPPYDNYLSMQSTS